MSGEASQTPFVLPPVPGVSGNESISSERARRSCRLNREIRDGVVLIAVDFEADVVVVVEGACGVSDRGYSR